MTDARCILFLSYSLFLPQRAALMANHLWSGVVILRLARVVDIVEGQAGAAATGSMREADLKNCKC